MSDKEDSPPRSRSRSRGSDRESQGHSKSRSRSRSRSYVSRSPSRGHRSRSRSASYGRRKYYKSRSRSRSPRYSKRRPRNEESPADSVENESPERYTRHRNMSMSEALPAVTSPNHQQRPSVLTRRQDSSSPEPAKCQHFQPFDPNCTHCLSDKRHESLLARYNATLKRYSNQSPLEVVRRCTWHPLRRCSRSHTREYMIWCRTCQRLGGLCLYPTWAYGPKNGASQSDSETEEISKDSSSLLIAAGSSHNSVHKVFTLQDGAEIIFYEFPVINMSSSNGLPFAKCDCDSCFTVDKERHPLVSNAGNYRGEPSHSTRGGYGSQNRPAKRQRSYDEAPDYHDRAGYGGSRHKRGRSLSYEYRYEKYRDGSRYQADQYGNHYDTRYGSERRYHAGYEYDRGKPPHWHSESAHTYGRGRGRGPRRGSGYSFQERKNFRQDLSRRYIGERENPGSSRCVGVFGLSLHTEERDIREVFSRYGSIEEIQMVYDHNTGRSRGFAFIYYRNVDDAVEAKERGPGIEIDGHKIRVDFSITERAHTPTPGIYLGKPSGRGYGSGGRREGGGGSSRRDSYYSSSRRSPSPQHYSSRRPRYSRSRSRSYSPRRY